MNKEIDNILMEIYSMAWQIANNSRQTIGEKHDYYIKLWQLDEILKKFQKEQKEK